MLSKLEACLAVVSAEMRDHVGTQNVRTVCDLHGMNVSASWGITFDWSSVDFAATCTRLPGRLHCNRYGLAVRRPLAVLFLRAREIRPMVKLPDVLADDLLAFSGCQGHGSHE